MNGHAYLSPQLQVLTPQWVSTTTVEMEIIYAQGW